MAYLAEIRKALFAAITAAGSAFSVAVQDGNVSKADVVTIVTAAVLAGLAVWGVPNEPSPKLVAAIVHGDKR